MYAIPKRWHCSICFPSMGTLSSIRTDAQIMRHITSHIHSRGSQFPNGTREEMKCHQPEGWPSLKYDQGGTGMQDKPTRALKYKGHPCDCVFIPGYIEGCHFHSVQPLQKWKGSHLDNSSHNGKYFIDYHSQPIICRHIFISSWFKLVCRALFIVNSPVMCIVNDMTKIRSESEWYMTLHHWNWYTILTKFSPLAVWYNFSPCWHIQFRDYILWVDLQLSLHIYSSPGFLGKSESAVSTVTSGAGVLIDWS